MNDDDRDEFIRDMAEMHERATGEMMQEWQKIFMSNVFDSIVQHFDLKIMYGPTANSVSTEDILDSVAKASQEPTINYDYYVDKSYAYEFANVSIPLGTKIIFVDSSYLPENVVAVCVPHKSLSELCGARSELVMFDDFVLPDGYDNLEDVFKEPEEPEINDISWLKKQVKRAKNPMEKKSWEQKLQAAFKRRKKRK